MSHGLASGGPGGGGVSDHGLLTGLADDDHTQYLLVDGTRALTAGWDFGNVNIHGGSNTEISGRSVYAVVTPADPAPLGGVALLSPGSGDQPLIATVRADTGVTNPRVRLFTADHATQANDIIIYRGNGSGPSLTFDDSATQWTFTDPVDFDGLVTGIAHSETEGRGTDDHHARDHAATHSDSGADEIDVVNLASSGAVGSYLERDGAGGLQWSVPAGGGGGLDLTTKGQLHTYSTVDAALNVGADGTLLLADSGETTGLGWKTMATAMESLLTTKGDIAVNNGTTVIRVPVGSNDEFLVADSTEAAGVKWAAAAATGWSYVGQTVISGTGTSSVSFDDTDWGTDAEDLLLVVTARTDRAAVNGDGSHLQFGDAGTVDTGATKYSWHQRTQGSGFSNTNSGGDNRIESHADSPFTAASADSGSFGFARIEIPSIQSTVQHQLAKWEGGRLAVTDDNRSAYGTGRWEDAGAIDILEIGTLSGDDFSTGTRITLYKRSLVGGSGGGSGIDSPTGSGEVFVSDDAGTAGIWIASRGEYAEAYRGTEANLLLDMQAAVDALPTRQGTVYFANTDYDFSTLTQTDSESHRSTYYPPGVTLQGAGRGSVQSGETPPTVFKVSGAASNGGYLLVAHDGESGNNNAEWQGYFVRDIHFEDASTGNDDLDGLILMAQGNQSIIERCSFGDLKKASSVAITIQKAPAGQTTQYGRIKECNIDVDHGGILFVNNSPDWEIQNCSIISRLDQNPSTGSFGVKGNSSAIRIIGCEIQMWDYGVYIDCSNNNEGKHWTLDRCHFEGHQQASDDTYTAMVYIDKSATTGWTGSPDVNTFTLIANCESGNLNTYQYICELEDGSSGTIDGTRITNWRLRGSAWLTSAHAKLNDGARSSIEVEGTAT